MMKPLYLIRPVRPCPLETVELVYESSLDQPLPEDLQNRQTRWHRLNAERKNSGKPVLQDLPLFRPGVPRGSDSRIQIPCGITSYRVTTLLTSPCHRWENSYTGAGLSIVPVCADNHILIGRRSGIVDREPGLYHVAAGHAHPDDHFPDRPARLTEAVLQELKEEMAVTYRDIEQMEFLGTGLNCHTSKTEFLSRVRLKETSAVYIRRWQEKTVETEWNEFENILALCNDRWVSARRGHAENDPSTKTEASGHSVGTAGIKEQSFTLTTETPGRIHDLGINQCTIACRMVLEAHRNACG